MTFTKFASATIIAVGEKTLGKVAHRAVFNYDSRDGYIYVRARAISSRVNDNWDGFTAKEIAKSYKTFVGKPVFVNHHNENHRRARGVIIDAALHEDKAPDGHPDTWVECLMEIDGKRFPKLAKAVLAGHIDKVSMGTDVAQSRCNACNNIATNPTEYCLHVPRMKGMRIQRVTASGKKESVLVYEDCYGLSFFELSLLVEEPADPTAYAWVDNPGKTAGKTAAGEVTSDPATHPENHLFAPVNHDFPICSKCNFEEHWHPHLHQGNNAVHCSVPDCNRDWNHKLHDKGKYEHLMVRDNPVPDDPSSMWRVQKRTAGLTPISQCKSCGSDKGSHCDCASTRLYRNDDSAYNSAIKGKLTPISDCKNCNAGKGNNCKSGCNGVRLYKKDSTEKWMTTAAALGLGVEDPYGDMQKTAQNVHLVSLHSDWRDGSHQNHGNAIVCGDHYNGIHDFVRKANDDLVEDANFDHPPFQMRVQHEHGPVDGDCQTCTKNSVDDVFKKVTKLAYGETIAPKDVDTLRDEECPVCAEKDSYDGNECQVCGFVKPPEMFMDPNLDKAKQLDLRKDQNDQPGGPPDQQPNPLTPAGNQATGDPNAVDAQGMPNEVPGSGTPGSDQIPMDPNAVNQQGLPVSPGTQPNMLDPQQPGQPPVPGQEALVPNGLTDPQTGQPLIDGNTGLPEIGIPNTPQEPQGPTDIYGQPLGPTGPATPGDPMIPTDPGTNLPVDPVTGQPLDREPVQDPGVQQAPQLNQPNVAPDGQPYDMEQMQVDQETTLQCPVCGFTTVAAPPQTVTTDAPVGGTGDMSDGAQEGDLCPQCGKGLLVARVQGMDGPDMQQGQDPMATTRGAPSSWSGGGTPGGGGSGGSGAPGGQQEAAEEQQDPSDPYGDNDHSQDNPFGQGSDEPDKDDEDERNNK